MHHFRPIALISTLAVALVASSCSHSTQAATAAAPSAPAQTPGQTTARPRPRRVPLSRDSVAHLRANYVRTVMAQIAGRENEPATRVFKNVQVLKDLTAGELVHKMDAEYGAGLSYNCSNCHRAVNGVVEDWSSDTLRTKKRARFMQTMVNVVNKEQLPREYPHDPPQISCGTCHRGYNEPPPPSVLIPPFGAPGGPPIPERFRQPSPAGRPPR
jgi:hypothetical protein